MKPKETPGKAIGNPKDKRTQVGPYKGSQGRVKSKTKQQENQRSTKGNQKEHQRETKENQRECQRKTHSKTTGKPEEGTGKAVEIESKAKQNNRRTRGTQKETKRNTRGKQRKTKGNPKENTQ